MENHKSHIFHTKRKIDFEENFEVRIERKRPALSLLKPRYCGGGSTRRGDRPWASRAPACPAFAKRPGLGHGQGRAWPHQLVAIVDRSLHAGAVAR